MSSSHPNESVSIYFTDFFGVDPNVLESYGAFDISLVTDLPLFVDPFLLFTSGREDYQLLHQGIIRYLQFLLNNSKRRDLDPGLIRAWFWFQEVKQNWLGFSNRGNSGRGLGAKFAGELYANLSSVFSDFGNERVTKGSHLEKLCLVSRGVGRDNISDFTVCLIKSFLLHYTQEFALKHLDPSYLWVGSVERSRFDYETETWVSEKFALPGFASSYVILSPKDILRRDDTWINRPDLLKNFEQLAASLPDEALRAQLNNYFRARLVYPPDATKEEKHKQRNQAIDETMLQFPQIIEYYISTKEESGDQAVSISTEEVADVFAVFVERVREYVASSLAPSGFYQLPHDSYKESMDRLMYYKSFIEDRDGYKLFYHEGRSIQREKDLQRLFALTWYGTPFDVNAEVNNGRGPVDFKVSFGSADKSLVEFKLAKNTKLKASLESQLAIYEKANDTKRSIWAIFYFSSNELERVTSILKELNLEHEPNIVLIDCREDNKPSASTA